MLSLSPLTVTTGFDVHAASTSVHRGRSLALSSSSRWIRVFASVAGEVAVVAVDHGQAGAHVAGEVEGSSAYWLAAVLIASSAIVCSGTAQRLASVFGHFNRPFVNERWT
jgi:hypothetical protein